MCFFVYAVACLGELGVFFGSILVGAVLSGCLVIVNIAVTSSEGKQIMSGSFTGDLLQEFAGVSRPRVW